MTASPETLAPFFLMGLIAVFLVLLLFLRRISYEMHQTLDKLQKTVDAMTKADAKVAVDLANSVSRADATVGPEGAAADAALRTGDTVKAILDRQDNR